MATQETKRTSYVTDGTALYSVDWHLRDSVILQDVRTGTLTAFSFRDFFQLQVVKPDA